MDKSEAYADIPGTYLFDKRACAKGYHVNNFCMSLMKEENRKAFLADGPSYLDRFKLTEEQRRAILNRDWLKLIQEGGNIYYVSKLGATCGLTFEDLAASMSGMKKEDYRKMMLSGGRSIEGNRSRAPQPNPTKEENA
ncbi:MAG: protocatechuate 4,5-dioxygenase subunit alpha [Acidobacteriia bacterium]|nr:protocatechuate 4,5-dioxygenase subunit alpha [Terriglobia bacterium]MBV8903665.1 protocatechuate 4,5-dioxygenase subunit alpha [Terriglobia bacterium]MBV9743312.1 protocatechuate 4,5-dioxygenase subunit alpha [Terriglobia bacterium]